MPSIVYEVINTSPELKTVYDYISDVNSPAFNYTSAPDDFLNVQNNKGTSNRTVIENSYSTNAEKKLKGKSAKELILKIGTRLAIEASKVNKAGLLTEGLEITSYDIPAFKAKALADLESNENYRTFTFNKAQGGQLFKGSLRQSFPDMTLWVWCRALASKDNNFEGEILNLTPFITETLSTDVSKDGGQFEFTMPPLVCEMDSDGKWVIKKNNIKFYKGPDSSVQKTDFLAQGALYEQKDGELKRNTFLFHTILSSQDLVFIRFETLEMEGVQRQTDSDKLNVPKSSLPNRIYDMIGLIDSNNIQIQASGTDVSITVSGRDLSKLFIEDGAYVFNLEISQGMLTAGGSTSQNGLSKRLIEDKGFRYLNLYFNNTIEKVIKFVFNQLTNIKVVPDDLFDHYFDADGNDRRNYRYDQEEKSTQAVDDKNAYRDRAKKTITALRAKNGLSINFLFGEEKSKVDNVYNETYRFLRDIRTKKVRKVPNDSTTGWLSFVYTNDRGTLESIKEDTYPDYFQQNLFAVEQTQQVDNSVALDIDKVIDIEDSTSDNSRPAHTTPAPGIWQIIKLALDTNVTGRKIIDSSLSTANGSLVNFLRKACQEPFVEMLMDTYGDMYYVMVRKPPTDKVGVLSMLSAQVMVEGQAKNTSKTSEPASQNAIAGVIDIEGDDVLVEQLSFNDTEAYSWYHLTPQANFLGGSQSSLAYLPAIFLPEYADIWGSRPLELQNNYLPTTFNDVDKNSLDIVYKQAVSDLSYIIESNAYLPFTRKGLIKTNGDRRYKVGNLIRYKPTGEIFHIDHVKQEFTIHEKTIDRTSTIQVSRGMVEQLIYGIPSRSPGGEVSYISYFNIVNTKPQFDYSNVTTYREETVKTGRKVVGQTANPLIQNESVLTGTNINAFSFNSLNQGMELLNEYPESTRGVFINFIQQVNALGWSVIIPEGGGRRTYSQQLALFNSRDLAHPAAAPGSKRGHEAGRALDINCIRSSQSLRKFSSSLDWIQSGIVNVATSLNLTWGGTFGDNDHFQMNGSDETPQNIYEDVYETKRTPQIEKSLDTGKIFSNFKVNKEVFNFFLRREQLDSSYMTVKDKGVYQDDGFKLSPDIEVKLKLKNK